jgi:SAM-dependent methyltransferase
MGMAQQRPIKGWFDTLGRPGDRTLKQQLLGLEQLIERVPNKSVLDVGCAEGLISMHLFDEGASAVHGLEVVSEHVIVANKLRGDRACTFEVADANDYVPKRDYDIVLLLAVLHKLRNPSQVAKRFAERAREMVVVRLPPASAPTVIDARSGGVPHHIGDVIRDCGFMLKGTAKGAFDEWVGYWERV